MIVRKTTNWLATLMLISACAVTANGQNAMGPMYSPYGGDSITGGFDTEAEWFAPVDFSFENQPLRKENGYFVRFEKLSWAFAGERTVIGDPDLNVQSENIYDNGSPFNEGTPPATYQINNSIQDAPPYDDWGEGDRYEFGYTSGGSGWLISILDGPELITFKNYGFRNLEISNTVPLSETDAAVPLGGEDGGFAFTGSPLPGTGSDDLSTSRNGFGSVHVNFRTPADYLQGFRDYQIGDGPVFAGPGRQWIMIESTTDPITGETTIEDATVSSGADGLADDLDGDAITFFTVIVGGNVVGTGVDFDDLHTFNIRFENFDVRNFSEMKGIELMRTVDLSNRHQMVKRQRAQSHIAYGMRFLRLRDRFYWEGKGDVLGRTYADTGAQNAIVGPQVRYMLDKQHGRWNFALDTRLMFGYNIQEQDQVGAIGEDLVPGGLNSLVGGQPHSVAYGQSKESFSPLVELRAETSYQFTRSIALKVGYNATFVDNITRASQTMNWYLPDLGILEGGQQSIFINGISAGFDVVY